MVNSELTPAIITLKYSSQAKCVVNGITIYHFYIECQNLRELPLDPNPRDPSEDRKPYKAMRDTLRTEPKMFSLKNLGINSIASKVTLKSNNIVELEFKPGLGVINGGHTMQAILDERLESTIDPLAKVRLEVVEFEYFDQSEVASIAQSKNLSTQIKPYSTAHYLGYFDPLIGCMQRTNADKIILYEGQDVDNPAMKGDELIVLLTMFNPNVYDTDNHPISCITGKGKVFDSWILENKNGTPSLSVLYPLTDSILDFTEYVRGTLNENCGTSLNRQKIISDYKLKEPVMQPFSGCKMSYNLPIGLIYPIFAAFRADIHIVDGKAEWIENPKLLFNRIKLKLIGHWLDAWKQDQNVTKFSRNKLLWKVLYDTVDAEKKND